MKIQYQCIFAPTLYSSRAPVMNYFAALAMQANINSNLSESVLVIATAALHLCKSQTITSLLSNDARRWNKS